MLAARGMAVDAAAAADAAVRAAREGRYDLVLCDRAWVGALVAAAPDATVVALGESRDAYDWLARPVHPDSLDQVLRRAGERVALLRENAALRGARPRLRAEPDDGAIAGLVGRSPAMRRVIREVRQVAPYKANVLITGESGTGKELVARALHDLSPRARGPFVAVNCGAIPPGLIESELFGHRRGAFTDAVRDKRGMFEEADGGTLFLDEIGELPVELQVKLLRALQEEEVRPVGASVAVRVDVRVVAATVRDLDADVAAGRFREDLYYRLKVVPIELPPLRERREDIPALVDHFVRRYADKHATAGMPVRGVTREAMAVLVDYPWPGNVRELENAIERAMVLCDGPEITAELLEERLRRSARHPAVTADPDDLSIKKASRALERRLIAQALERTGGNRTNAAKLLEISHRALLYKIKEYGL
ncbi:MAG: sigma-54-dependent Fis family transcriptional regulator [Deltaproteobacteria bacterium]|nr:MAG: sigma-54-dependent Fis family transcriptional regulator [Deltaproteobacteria bacterium]